MKKILCALIAAMFVASAAGCGVIDDLVGKYINGEAGTTQATEPTRATEITAEPLTEAVTTVEPTTAPVNLKAEDYVVTEDEFTAKYAGKFLITGEDYNKSENPTASCRMPQLTLTSSDAVAINNSIHQEFSSGFEQTKKYTEYPLGRIDYVCFVNGSTLSLAVESRSTDTPNSYIKAYNIDVLTGKKLTNNQVCELAGTTEDKALETVKGEIKKLFKDTPAASQPSAQSALKDAESQSFSQENLDKIEYYLNGDGKLVASYRYYWIAGASNYGAIYTFN